MAILTMAALTLQIDASSKTVPWVIQTIVFLCPKPIIGTEFLFQHSVSDFDSLKKSVFYLLPLKPIEPNGPFC